jgi:hypothetical protein
MLREFCNEPAHLKHAATVAGDGRELCPVCAGTRLSFTQWSARLDDAVIRRLVVSVFDLPDMPFRDWFDQGVTPVEAAELVEIEVAA